MGSRTLPMLQQEQEEKRGGHADPFIDSDVKFSDSQTSHSNPRVAWHYKCFSPLSSMQGSPPVGTEVLFLPRSQWPPCCHIRGYFKGVIILDFSIIFTIASFSRNTLSSWLSWCTYPWFFPSFSGYFFISFVNLCKYLFSQIPYKFKVPHYALYGRLP